MAELYKETCAQIDELREAGGTTSLADFIPIYEEYVRSVRRVLTFFVWDLPTPDEVDELMTMAVAEKETTQTQNELQKKKANGNRKRNCQSRGLTAW